MTISSRTIVEKGQFKHRFGNEVLGLQKDKIYEAFKYSDGVWDFKQTDNGEPYKIDAENLKGYFICVSKTKLSNVKKS